MIAEGAEETSALGFLIGLKCFGVKHRKCLGPLEDISDKEVSFLRV